MFAIAIVCVSAWSVGGLPVDRVRVDLDGDGRAETAALSFSSTEWVLRLGGREFHGICEAEPERIQLKVVDLRRGDKFKEVAVHDPGPSEDDCWTYFAILRGKPVKLGAVQSWPTVHGDGTISVRLFQDFWETIDRYRYETAKRRLVWQPRRTYRLDVVATATKSIPVVHRPGDAHASMTLSNGTRLRLIAAARRGKLAEPPTRSFEQFDYQVRFVANGTTRTGWIASANVQSLNGLQWAD